MKSVDTITLHEKAAYTSHSTLGLIICGQETKSGLSKIWSLKCETTLDGIVMQVSTKQGAGIDVNFATSMS